MMSKKKEWIQTILKGQLKCGGIFIIFYSSLQFKYNKITIRYSCHVKKKMKKKLNL